MKRRKNPISVKTGALDWTSVPVTRKDLVDEWHALKKYNAKRCFSSFLKGDIEYIYAFRFLKKDTEPVAQIAFIRTKDACYVNRKMNFGYMCGYIMNFDGGVHDFHQPKKKAFELAYATPTMMCKVYESNLSKNRVRPSTYTAETSKYGLKTIKALRYLPDNALSEIKHDPTYYLAYIMESENNIYVAEMLSKLGHPECLTDRNWFSLDKKELIAMVRYAQKAGMRKWKYGVISWNMKNNAPEKAYDYNDIKKLGVVKNTIKWATSVSEQREVLRYLERQNETLDTYYDYFHMRDELKLPYESHSARYPSNLTRAHDELAKEFENMKDIWLAKKEKVPNAKLKAIADKVNVDSKKYIVLVPKSKGDFRYYGKVMDDCLGMPLWSENVIEKKCFVFLLATKENDTVTPYMVCEVRRPNKKLMVKQLYLRHNKQPTASERRYVTGHILPQLEGQIL